MKHNKAFIERLKRQGEPKKALLDKALDEHLEHRVAKIRANQTLSSIWRRIDQSLSEWYRYRVTDQKCGETWVEYRLLPPMTPEEIEEAVNDDWITINSPYDCTGRAFTISIHTHINPNGWVSWIHKKGLDV